MWRWHHSSDLMSCDTGQFLIKLSAFLWHCHHSSDLMSCDSGPFLMKELCLQSSRRRHNDRQNIFFCYGRAHERCARFGAFSGAPRSSLERVTYLK